MKRTFLGEKVDYQMRVGEETLLVTARIRAPSRCSPRPAAAANRPENLTRRAGDHADALVVVQKGDHSLGYYDLHPGAKRHRLALDPYPREFALSSKRAPRLPLPLRRGAPRGSR